MECGVLYSMDRCAVLWRVLEGCGVLWSVHCCGVWTAEDNEVQWSAIECGVLCSMECCAVLWRVVGCCGVYSAA